MAKTASNSLFLVKGKSYSTDDSSWIMLKWERSHDTPEESSFYQVRP